MNLYNTNRNADGSEQHSFESYASVLTLDHQW